MGRPAKLSEDSILTAAMALVADRGACQFSMRELGESLGVDPSAVYRHFRSKNDMLRALVDQLLIGVTVEPGTGDWQVMLRRSCIGLRRALLAAPGLIEAMNVAPPRLANEARLADNMLGSLRRAGLGLAEAADCYHALIELTLGSVAVDAPLALAHGAQRRAAYALWRADYAALHRATHPHARAAARHLYRGTAERRFEVALDLMLAGIAVSRRTLSGESG